MKDDLNNLDRDQKLAAFADGELDDQARQEVVQAMTETPDVARQVLYQQQLKQAVGQHLTGQMPAMSDSLRGKLTALAEDVPVEEAELSATPAGWTENDSPFGASTGREPVIAKIGGVRQWAPLAVAAMVMFAALVVFFNAEDRTGPGQQAGILPVGMIEQFDRRHMRCSMKLDELHPGPFKNELAVAEVEATARDYLSGAGLPSLDLSRFDYRFREAGECTIPGRKSVHLIYEKIEPKADGQRMSASLWITGVNEFASKGGKTMQPGILYREVDQQTGQTMWLWTDGQMDYFLIGEDREGLRAIGEAMTQRS